MLAKSFRLPITIRLSQAKTIHTPFFIFKFAANALSHPRLGVVVSKKVDARATRRNTLRRLIHQIIQDELSSLKPYDMLFILKPEAGVATKEAVKEAVKTSLKHL